MEKGGYHLLASLPRPSSGLILVAAWRPMILIEFPPGTQLPSSVLVSPIAKTAGFA